MEPLFLPEDELFLLPKELHPPIEDFGLTTSLETGRGGRNTKDSEQGKDKPIGGGDTVGRGSEEEIGRQVQRRGKLQYDRHSVHVVTQYYVPENLVRAREVWPSYPWG